MMHLWSKYGRELFDIDGIGKQCDMNWFAKNFFNNNTTTADTSVDSNSNVIDKNINVFNAEFSKPFQRYNSYYLLWKELKKLYGLGKANQIIEDQLTGSIYVNDFSNIGMAYCFNYSTYDIALGGLPMIQKITSVAPKHLYSFKSQIEQFTIIAANSTLGATGLADFLVVMAHYVENILITGEDAHFKFNSEEDVWTYVKETLASIVYTLNQPTRSQQSPFSNISIFDDVFLDSLCADYKFIRNNETVGVNKDIVKKIQSVFCDVMNETLRRTPCTFPVTTACCSVDDEGKILDPSFVEFIAEKNLEFAFINIFCGKSSVLSSCCRLRSETTNEYFNSFGSGSSKIGSLGVCTMNLPRLAMDSKTDEEFLSKLKDIVMDAARVNNAKRHIIKKRIDLGAYDLYKYGFMDLKRQYSTCGVTGLNECCDLLGHDILKESGQEFILKILEVINKTNDEMQARYKMPHNSEQVPAENSSIKLVTKDRYMGYNVDCEFYSNQFIPLVTKADILDRIKLQGMFDKHFSGGAICHLNIEQQLKNKQVMVDMIHQCAKMGVVYWAINYQLNRCVNGHMTVGTTDICSICGEPIEDKYMRVVGFLTAVKNWHKTRREVDFPNRQFY
jgi:ribonucleoside-triphosphate reductase